ncbi:cytochrome c oxidase accessory protein CcoG [Cellvibrio sp.]|uniref:cytochrome c oxidase accessory protein CcoG n=1 Tax=Cellvibrio sp. TaxID=1965322 RepID=UPI0039647F40
MNEKSKQPEATKEVPAPEIRYVNLYESEEKVYTRRITGYFQRLRRYVSAPLMLGFLLMPWLVIDGRPAMLFDLPARQFNILWMTFSPQDGVYLAWLLIISAFLLFTVTVMVGRVWCGFTCPQTIWTQMFMWAEFLCEGDRNKRIKLDSQKLSLEKVLRKSAKHFIWVAIALVTAMTFVGYFTPIRELATGFFTFDLDLTALFWVLFFTGATYGNAGFMREQVCKYMCPYARFQSVMYDQETLAVWYNKERGEKRGPRKPNEDYKAQGLGDCIDCSWCVQVCPVNIDIREGLQAECIDCGLCIDACDSVMDKMNYPRGLISFTTEEAAAKKKVKIIRPRVLGYGFVLLAMVSVFVYSLATRMPLVVEVIRDRGTQMYKIVDGNVSNVYTIKIENLDRKTHVYDVTVNGDFTFDVQGYKAPPVLEGEILNLPIRVVTKRSELKGEKNTITFKVVARENPDVLVLRSTTFIGPSK